MIETFTTDKLLEEIENACFSACIPISDKIYNMIQPLVDNINKECKVHYIEFVMGSVVFDTDSFSCYDNTDEEYYTYKLNDLYDDYICNYPYLKSNYWKELRYDYPTIIEDIMKLFDLLQFINNTNYIEQRLIKPNDPSQ